MEPDSDAAGSARALALEGLRAMVGCGTAGGFHTGVPFCMAQLKVRSAYS